MVDRPAETLGSRLIEVVGNVITDPPELAAISKQLHQPRRRYLRVRWLVAGAAVAMSFAAGLITGRWLFGSAP